MLWILIEGEMPEVQSPLVGGCGSRVLTNAKSASDGPKPGNLGCRPAHLVEKAHFRVVQKRKVVVHMFVKKKDAQSGHGAEAGSPVTDADHQQRDYTLAKSRPKGVTLLLGLRSTADPDGCLRRNAGPRKSARVSERESPTRLESRFCEPAKPRGGRPSRRRQPVDETTGSRYRTGSAP